MEYDSDQRAHPVDPAATIAVVGTDTVLSGWGRAAGRASYAAWACRPDQLDECYSWVASRSDMQRVRVVRLATWRPNRQRAHVSIYDWTPRPPITRQAPRP